MYQRLRACHECDGESLITESFTELSASKLSSASGNEDPFAGLPWKPPLSGTVGTESELLLVQGSHESELWKSKAGVLVYKDRVGLRIDLATGQN